ncbi:uncharacterized protein [Miscanthus floridulus]|uniref:uncharacterized protein n=1 Tax=Miscanthus floridulus TaxID=154761 RepID=UPI00345A26E4
MAIIASKELTATRKEVAEEAPDPKRSSGSFETIEGAKKVLIDLSGSKGKVLNPEKCVFGIPRGMLLGFIIFERGINANSKKISAITRMGPIQNIKGVQQVMGCLATLSRFISCLDERGLPLYWLLKKVDHFESMLKA